MAHFNTLYYFFAVLAVLSVLTQAAPVQQRDESGLPTGLNGLLGGQNTPGADPTKMMSEVEGDLAKSNAGKSQQAENVAPTPSNSAPSMIANPQPSESATPTPSGDASQAQPSTPPSNPLEGLPLVGPLLGGIL